MKELKIGYYPYINNNNKYIEISKRIIENCGYHLMDYSNLRFRDFKDLDCVVLNWYESIYDNRTSMHIYVALRKFFKVFIIKKSGCKIVFTFHNKQPHESGKWLLKPIDFLLMKFICYYADKIIVLSEDSKHYLSRYISEKNIGKKAFYIPHPNYIGEYSEPLQQNIYYRTENFKILFIGAIKPYKNIELIITAANDLASFPIEFTIAGECHPKYAEELQKKVNSMAKLNFNFGFIDDNEIDNLVRHSDVILLPYNMDSSMNSGTEILAFSNGRTVISPEISTIKEYDSRLTYHYTYQSKDDHLKKVKENIVKAFNEWKYDNDSFEQKGTQLYNAVKERNSSKVIFERYNKLFDYFRES